MIKARSGRWYSWLRDIVAIVVIFVVSSTAMDWWRSRDLNREQLPVSQMQSLEGSTIDIQALSRDEPVMLYFWASWCGVCRFVTPSVDWMSDGHQVVSVAVNSGENRRVQGYLNHHDYQLPTVNDPNGALSSAFSISATPTVMAIEDGKITSVTTGFTSPIGLWLRMIW